MTKNQEGKIISTAKQIIRVGSWSYIRTKNCLIIIILLSIKN